MNGTIIEKHAVVGELVEPGRDTMILADLNTVWVWGGVDGGCGWGVWGGTARGAGPESVAP
jgi:hypothetical protein